MKFKTKYILELAVILCTIIVPAMSQGDDRAGMNGMQGNGMGPAGNWAPDTIQNSAPWDQGNGQAPLADDKKFKGCNTLPKKLNDKKPIEKPATDEHPPDKPEGFIGSPADNPDKVNDGGLAPWVYAGKGPGDLEFGIAPADPNRRMDIRWITPGSPQKMAPEKAPKKSIMKDWRKKLPRPLIEKPHQEIPPKKSIMKDWKKEIPRPLMENYFPAKPPLKSIMGHLI